MTAWQFAYVLSATADERTARRTILQFERTFGLLAPDESAIWTHQRAVMMMLLGTSPRRLWVEGRVELVAIALLNRN